MRRSNEILFNDSLILDVYLIGYNGIGESIIFIVKADDKVSYTGVIDCYEYNGLNKTIDILRAEKIKFINFLCWTHPDEDHSLGIDKILKYANKNSLIFLPEDIDGSELQYNDRIKDTFSIISRILGRKRNFNVMSVSDSKNLDERKYKGYIGKSEIYPFCIKSISPNSSLLRKRKLSQRQSLHKNDYSIGLILSLGEFDLLFSGDIENTTINNLRLESIPSKFNYIKVPHHTSKSSSNLLKILDGNLESEIACTTSYSQYNLPDVNLIKKYSYYAQKFYCTDCINPSKMIDEDFGIVKVTFDIVRSVALINKQGRAEEILYTGL